MAQLAPQEVKGQREKVLAGGKVLDVSLIINDMKYRGNMVKMSHVNP